MAGTSSEQHSTELVALPTEPLAPSQEELKLPRHGTRGSAPGPRGCWAVKRNGEPCGAASRNDSDYCNAHSGVGVGSNPKGFAKLGSARAAANRQHRASVRMTLGLTRAVTPKAVLRASVFDVAEPLARRGIDAALDPEANPIQAGRLALALLEAAEPPHASVSVEGSFDPSTASLAELLSFAERHGIAVPGQDSQPSIEG